MTREEQQINTYYEELLFAKSQKAARTAAVRLVHAVLGDKARSGSLAENLRKCCRVLRPSADRAEQARFEQEFLELAVGPSKSQQAAA